MAATTPLFFLITIALAAATNITTNTGFDREKCYTQTLEWIKNGTLAENDEVFFRDASGQPMNQPENLILTVPGCEKLCGAKQRWYFDIGPRLTVWLLPIFILVSNIELSPLDKRRFLAIIHLLGDPIDSTWSLVDKLDSWDRCQTLARQCEGLCERCQRMVATVFAGFEEVQGPRIKSHAYYRALLQKHSLKTRSREWRRAAIALADSRTNELPRTYLAIVLYIFQLIASFVKVVGGGNTSAPGGRIATLVFLSWLLPVALLSNAIGNFPSRRTCHDILSLFAQYTGHTLHIPRSQSTLSLGPSFFSRSCSTGYYGSLVWSGGIYTFRPWKWRYTCMRHRWPRAALILLLSIMPSCIGMIGGFIILSISTPAGLNCRHTWLIGIFLAWCASAFATSFLNSSKYATGKYHWYLVLIKDALIAVPSITIIVLSACGLFNSCYCWSGILHGRKNARVLLQSLSFDLNAHFIYPLIVGVCNAAQLLLFILFVMIWHRGFRLFRWSESMIRTERQILEGDIICSCIESAL